MCKSRGHVTCESKVDCGDTSSPHEEQDTSMIEPVTESGKPSTVAARQMEAASSQQILSVQYNASLMSTPTTLKAKSR